MAENGSCASLVRVIETRREIRSGERAGLQKEDARDAAAREQIRDKIARERLQETVAVEYGYVLKRTTDEQAFSYVGFPRSGIGIMYSKHASDVEKDCHSWGILLENMPPMLRKNNNRVAVRREFEWPRTGHVRPSFV